MRKGEGMKPVISDELRASGFLEGEIESEFVYHGHLPDGECVEFVIRAFSFDDAAEKFEAFKSAALSRVIVEVGGE